MIYENQTVNPRRSTIHFNTEFEYEDTDAIIEINTSEACGAAPTDATPVYHDGIDERGEVAWIFQGPLTVSISVLVLSVAAAPAQTTQTRIRNLVVSSSCMYKYFIIFF